MYVGRRSGVCWNVFACREMSAIFHLGNKNEGHHMEYPG